MAIALVLAGCTTGPAVVGPIRAPAFDAAIRETAPPATAGQCWQDHMRPALFETVTEQIVVTPEQRDPAGKVIRAATFRSETRQSELRPRQTIWFRVPCPADGIEETSFVASLQRALKARGLFGGAITGRMDPETQSAVHRYQLANGLDSPVLSLAAGRALGLISVDR